MISIGIPIDLQRLIETRMLINAGSGGGKSYLIRQLLESISGHAHQIVFDYEGEFVTLREKFPFALVAVEGGDIPLSVRYAGKLAETIMQTNLSVIIDLYDLEPEDRIIFVHEFIHSLMKLPKELYHPTLVYLDEIDVFCPQVGLTDASKDIRNLAARGRKRGLGMIAATQRLSKVHKDVAAECQNKLIGQTTLGIDISRAGEELGLPTKEQGQLRDLEPGNFLAYGPAISRKVTLFKVKEVMTTHVPAGTTVAPPPTPNAIRAIIAQLKDIPAEAEKELETIDELKAEIARQQSEISKIKISSGTETGGKEVKELKDKVLKLEGQISLWRDYYHSAFLSLDEISRIVKKAKNIGYGNEKLPEYDVAPIENKSDAVTNEPKISLVKPVHNEASSALSLGKCAKAILSFLAGYPGKDFTKAQISVITGYTATSSGFLNSLSELSTKGLIIRGPRIRVHPDASPAELALYIGAIRVQQFNQETFKGKLNKCEREIYEILLAYPRIVYDKEVLAEKTPSRYSPTSSGFLNSLSTLSSLELIVREKGQVRLNPEILELL